MYFEDCLERAAYLLAHGVVPSSGKWVERLKDGQPTFRFQYEHTPLLGSLLMAFKGSRESVAMDVFVKAYHLRGRFIKSLKSNMPIDAQAHDLTRLFKTYKPPYEA